MYRNEGVQARHYALLAKKEMGIIIIMNWRRLAVSLVPKLSHGAMSRTQFTMISNAITPTGPIVKRQICKDEFYICCSQFSSYQLMIVFLKSRCVDITRSPFPVVKCFLDSSFQ